jgi:hypothetical protein
VAVFIWKISGHGQWLQQGTQFCNHLGIRGSSPDLQMLQPFQMAETKQHLFQSTDTDGVTGYPTLKFFPKNKDGEDYDADRTLAAFVDFLNEKAGTSCTTTGTLNDDAGKVSSLDEIVPDFLSAKPEQ